MKHENIAASVKMWHSHLSNIGECTIGEHGIIHSHVWIADGVKIGNRVRIQAFSFIPSGVTIGDDVFIGPHACFMNDKEPPSYGEKWAKTIVEDNVSVGAGAVILPGIILGKGCHIGAGAVVTHSVPSGETWVGNPARKM